MVDHVVTTKARNLKEKNIHYQFRGEHATEIVQQLKHFMIMLDEWKRDIENLFTEIGMRMPDRSQRYEEEENDEGYQDKNYRHDVDHYFDSEI